MKADIVGTYAIGMPHAGDAAAARRRLRRKAVMRKDIEQHCLRMQRKTGKRREAFTATTRTPRARPTA